MIKQKVFNLAFRVFSIAGRFLLIFYIGANFSVELLGDYGIFFTTVTLSVLIVGYDFYAHTNRELLKVNEEDQGNLLFNQLIAHAIVYLITLPFFYLLFYFEYISSDLLILFYLLLALEHIGLEIFRILIVLEQSILANILFFIRTGLWIFLLLPYWYMQKIIQTDLSAIMLPWVYAGILSNGIGIIYLIRRYKGTQIKINQEWIKEGFVVATKFLIGTASYKIIEFSDRYMVDYAMGREIVGVYTFYTQLSNMLSTVLFTLVITLLYPKLLKAIYNNNKTLFKEIKRSMLKEILIFSGIAIIGAFFLFDPVLTLMGKEIFTKDKDVFYLLLFATILFNLSYVYHFILIGYHRDNEILYISIFIAAFNIILNILLISSWGLYGAGISKLVSFGLIYILKYRFAQRAQVFV
ncbi:MAG: polysaccharide biosynthesis C-terminal domain-containing protein [Flavobacteriales bacterium]|nr:polysaccharide biosynthesis C-terminal domain-containing protein [Flavobacteriales bacterium]